jgi:hypothetical protein
MSICSALCGVCMSVGKRPAADILGVWPRLSQVVGKVNPLTRIADGESEWHAMSNKELEAELKALKAAITRGVLPQLSPTASRESLTPPSMGGEP